MSRLETAIQNDLKLLKLARDELKLQSHLLKADLKDRWGDLEDKWQKLDEHLGRAKVAADDAGDEIETSAKLLVDALQDGYKHIRSALKS